MSFTIAVSGKGGSGKTTLATLLILCLLRRNMGPILAVDADPNSNLNIGLGMELGQTVADLREHILSQEVPQGISKPELLDLRMQECLVEGDNVDLLVMGRPEGPGCYCAVNNLLRQYLSRISRRYRYVVVDNEAGMEHLSRRTTDDVDLLVITCDPTLVSVRSAIRIYQIALLLKLRIKKICLVMNRIADAESIPSFLLRMLPEELQLAGTIPEDSLVFEASEKEKDLLSLPEESIAFQAVCRLAKELNLEILR